MAGMKTQTSLLLLTSVLALSAVLGAGLAGCSSEHSDDFTPPASVAPTTPVGTPTQPTTATFAAKVNPFLTTNNCSTASCHGTPGVGDTAAHPYVVAASGTAGNYTYTACNPRFTSYGASPAGVFLSKFCTSPTAGIAHNGTTATSQNCTDFYAWAAEGNGAPPTCP